MNEVGTRKSSIHHKTELACKAILKRPRRIKERLQRQNVLKNLRRKDQRKTQLSKMEIKIKERFQCQNVL